MSFWYEPKLEDIDLSDDFEEIHIYIAQDKFGSIYVSVKVKDIKEILQHRPHGKYTQQQVLEFN